MESSEQKLLRLQQELDSLKEEYQDFAYIVSHDLGAPFRTIEGFSKIIIEKNSDDFDEKTLKNFNHIVNGIDKGKEMLDALLQYSRLDTRAESFVECDCNIILNEVKSSLSTILQESQAVVVSEPLPIVSADKKQLSLLFYCLLHNAVLYRQKDIIPEIYIACQDYNDKWIFSVRDNGIGIKDNLQEKIFKVLRRGVSNKKYPGMGMGLALTNKIVRQHGGDMSVDAEPGKGSIFYFTFKK